MNQPDYSKIFASGAAIGEILNMPDDSYLRGWGYLNASEPPPMEFFNFIMHRQDERSHYLFSGSRLRMNSTRYEVGEVVTTPELNKKFVLICKTAGQTDISEPAWPKEATASVNDGACRWEVREYFNAKTLNGKDNSYFENLISNGAKINKITFDTASAAWSDDGVYKRLAIARNGLTCIAAFRVTGSTEEQIMAGITMDSNSIYIKSLDKFDGYIIVVDFNK